MTKHITCFFLAVIFFFTTAAQSLDSMLNLYNTSFPQEKIHIQTDKETYLPGETIWFKAYLLADDLPTTVSTNLYVDLLDSTGKRVEYKAMPILAATADSYFTLPDTSGSKYTIRAYTTWMLNFDTAFIYYKTITVHNNNETTNIAEEKANVILRFFPESGNMVADQYNYIAFKAVQDNGLPYAIQAAIKDSKGQLIDNIESVHDGMGILKFTPVAGETYAAEWKDNKGEYRRTPLPLAQQQGIILHTEQLNGYLYYLITKSSNTDNIKTFKLLATMNQKPVYTATIQTNNQNRFYEKFSTKDISSGILQLTVFDINNQPLAERIVFINNNNYIFKTNLTVTESSTKKRGKNKIEIEVPDTISTNLSMAIYDAGLEQQETGRNIYTDLLLQGDLRGYVYNASWYFSDTAANASEYLDLVMQTNGWRRYNWDKIFNNQVPLISYQRDDYLKIYGKASDDKLNPSANQTVGLLVETQDSTKQWYMPVTNKEGLFTQPGLIFYDTATVFYKADDKEKGIGVGIARDFNGLTDLKMSTTAPPGMPVVVIPESFTDNTYTQTFITEIKNKNPEFEKKAKLLNEVVIKTNSRKNWKNDPMVKMDENYTTGTFRGGATSSSFDLLHDPDVEDKQDIYNYLSGKIPGLTIQYSNMGKTLQVRNPNSFSGGFVEPIIFVNESLLDNDYLRTIPLDQIAYVKFFDNSYGRVPVEQQKIPSVAIYLKKGKDYEISARLKPGNLNRMKIAGYSPLKEFYSPDYSTTNDKQPRTDLRTTLLWRPYILTNKENKKVTITFYNNDITTRLKVVLEGMNEEGKLIHLEKTIEE